MMPTYSWLATAKVDPASTSEKLRAMQMLGVPYEKDLVKSPGENMVAQDNAIRDRLKADGTDVPEMSEMTAMIAYLQRLGTDIKKADPKELSEEVR